MNVTQSSQSLPEALEHLRATPSPTGRVFSVYLNTIPEGTAGPAQLIHVRDACKELRASLAADELRAFERAATQVEAYLLNQARDQQPGMAVFASGDPAYFTALSLPKPPTFEADWDESPHLAPLQTLIDDLERFALVLFDNERARLYTIHLGAIESQREMRDDTPGKQATGGWYSLAQTRIARHREDHLRRHADRTAQALLEELRQRPFDRLLVAGPPEPLALLKQRLPRPLRARLAGTLSLEMFATEAKILEAALLAAAEVEREQEVADVLDLNEAAHTRHAALGIDPTLAALSEGRVHRLFLAADFSGQGGACPNCRRLVAGPGPCPLCGTAITPVADLRERVLQSAAEQGATIEMVAGEAARLLMLHNGIGAWTRY